MKCSISSGSTLFVKGKISSDIEYNIFCKLKPDIPNICTIDSPKFIVSNQKEESISIQRVYVVSISFQWKEETKK